MFSPTVQKLIDELSKLPGIGPKTAQRLTFHLLKLTPEEALPLAQALIDVKETVRFCTTCFNLTEEELCDICRMPGGTRPPSAWSKSRATSSASSGPTSTAASTTSWAAPSPPGRHRARKLHLAELFERVRDEATQEVIVATNPNMAGEATALYIAEELRAFTSAGTLRITRPAAGLPMGGDLEYADEVTLGRALTGRRDSDRRTGAAPASAGKSDNIHGSVDLEVEH